MIKPKNIRDVKPKNSCANCDYNVYEPLSNLIGDDLGYRACKRSGESEWGEPEYMYHVVCDGHKRQDHL